MPETHPAFDNLVKDNEAIPAQLWKKDLGRLAGIVILIGALLLGCYWFFYHFLYPPPPPFNAYGDSYPQADLFIELNEDGSASIENAPVVPTNGRCPPPYTFQDSVADVNGTWGRTWPWEIVVTSESGIKYHLTAHQSLGSIEWHRVTLDVCMSDGSIGTVSLWSYLNP